MGLISIVLAASMESRDLNVPPKHVQGPKYCSWKSNQIHDFLV
jgi:hypothetical protein